MATDFAPPVMSGLMIPDPRIITANLDAADSTYTQAGPFPGAVVSQDTPRSQMTFRSSGTQSAAKQLRLRCGRGGSPGFDESAGGLHWKYEGDANWRGWEPYHIPSGAEILVYAANASTAEAGDSCIISLRNGTALLAYRSALTGAADDLVSTRIMTPGSAWTSAVSVTPTVQHAELHPCLVQLPDDSILMLYWVVDTVANVAQVQVQRSTDSGATWTLSATAALITELSTSTYTLGRLRAAYSNGQVLLVASVDDGTPRLAQFASDDNGASFTQVEIWSSIRGRTFEVVARESGGFVIGYIDATVHEALCRIVTSAFEPASNATAITASRLAQTEISMFIDTDQTIYMVKMPDMNMVRSVDGGANWESLDDSAAYGDRGLWDTATAGITPRDFSACAVQGRGVIACQLTSSGSSTIDTDSVLIMYSGGSSTVTMPTAHTFDRDTRMVTHDNGWFPLEFMGDYTPWTRTAGGTPTEAFSSDGVNVTCANGDTLYWSDTRAASVVLPLLVDMEFQVDGGGALTSNVISLTMRLADGTDDYEVTLRFTTTGLRAVDRNNGSSTIGTDATVDMTGGVQIRAGLDAGQFYCWYRVVTSSTDTDRVWTAGPNGSATNDAATPNAAGLIEWGHTVTPAISSQTTWRMFCIGFVDDNRPGWGAGQTNPDAVFPRPISRHAIGIDDGVKVEAIDGPCYEGETWNIDTRYQYGVECMDPFIHPSPQRTHRSTDTTQHEYAWDLHGLTANSRLGVQTAALYVEGNWRTGELFGKTNGGAYVSLGTVDSAVNRNGLKYSLVGDVVTVDTGVTTDAAEYIHYNDFAGGTFFLADGKPRKIIRHTEGSWTDQLTRRPEFFLDGIDGTEATTGTVGAIWSPRLLVVVHNLQEYRYLKLRVDAQTTVDGYLETKVATLGPVHVFGQGYSWGRRVTVTPNVALTTRRDGSRVARRNGESRMAVDLAWRDGINEWALYPTAGGNPVPNYQTGTTTGGTQPISNRYDTAHKVQGISHELAEDMLCVYIPRIDRGTPDIVQYASRWDMLYGRIRGPVGLENIIGDSRSGEIWRIANVRIEQEQ